MIIMLEKFTISLFHPRRIAMLISDKLLNHILYVILLILISLIPTIIEIIHIDAFAVKELHNIQRILNENQETFETIVIEDGVLKYDEEKIIYYESLEYLAFNYKNPVGTQIIISFNETSVKYLIMGLEVDEKSYADLGIENFSFKNLMNYLEKEELLFYNAYKKILNENIIYSQLMYFIIIVFMIILNYFVFCLIAPLFIYSKRVVISYKIRFTMALYCGTIYLLSSLIADLFSFGFISYIGLILAFIYLHVSINSIIRIEMKK